jgi:GAF domain-containing protein
LPEIAKELSTRLDINKLTEVVLNRSAETVEATKGHLILLEPGGPIHRQYCRAEAEPGSLTVNFPPLNDLVDRIRHSHQGLIIGDTQRDPHWQLVPANPALSVIMVPMFGHLDLIGLLILAHEQTGYFKPDHLLLLQAIASQAAIAIEYSRLYERMAQEQGRLAAVLSSTPARKNYSEVISSSWDCHSLEIAGMTT